jgi:signal transduction histidine kinase
VNEELKTNLEEIESKNKEITALAGHLEQVNTTKDKLFSIIGHDLLSPIHSLNGLLSLITNDHISKEQFSQLTTKLKKDVEHFEFTLNNLLQWARGQLTGLQTNMQKVELWKLVDRNINFLMKSASDKNIELRNNVDQEMSVTADQDQLDIVIRNLISNAIKFTPNAGKIILASKKANHSAIITITDTGIGMDQTTVEKLFKQNIHFTTRGTQGEHGSGLGLLLCKEMIERNNGKIGIESSPGSGTTFFVELPV